MDSQIDVFSSIKSKNNWKLKKKTILVDDKEPNSRKCQELGLLLILVAVAILTYSSLIYFAEREVAQVNNDDDHLDVVGDGQNYADCDCLILLLLIKVMEMKTVQFVFTMLMIVDCWFADLDQLRIAEQASFENRNANCWQN